MESSIIQTNTQVYIQNIPPLQWSSHRDNTFIRSTQFALQCLGKRFSYDYLMGISGAAFRTHFHPDFCPSSIDATVGYDVSSILFNTVGVQSRIEFIDTNSFMDIRNYFLKVKKQVDRSIPIIAINLKVSPDWGLITGYYKNKPGILCRTYYDQTEEYSDAERAPWASFFISKKEHESIHPKKIFTDSVKRIVTLAKTKKYEEYYNGFAAFEYWIRGIENIRSGKRDKEFREKMNGNNIIFHFLLDARIAAYNYLNTSTFFKLLPTADQIVNIYKNIVDIMQQTCLNDLPPLSQDKADWSMVQLEKQIKALEEIYALEMKGVQWIEKDLHTIQEGNY